MDKVQMDVALRGWCKSGVKSGKEYLDMEA